MKFSQAVWIFVVLFGASVLGAGWLVTRAEEKRRTAEAFAHEGSGRALKALWAAPNFEFPDHRGTSTSNFSLQGKPWVANFIFTTCRSVCPLLTAKMMQVQRKLAGEPVNFVSFSVDPEHDDAAALNRYAQHWAKEETRWSLLATTPESLPRLLSGFKVMAEKSDSGPDPIVHTSIFVLVDRLGQVRGVYDSEHREEFQALVSDARTLSQAPQKVAVETQRSGSELYAQLSCGNCHDDPALAPPLGGLVGRKVELENGLLVDADDAYVLESILVPDAKRVRGYPLRMPTYDGVVSAVELIELVKYVKELKPTADVQEHRTAVDPICHMEVTIDEKTPRFAGDAGTVYFCSESCLNRYVKGEGHGEANR